MVENLRMSAQTLKVLSALLAAAGGELSGAEIGKQGKIMSGTLYPILIRLEAVGWLQSRWEVEEPQGLGRPRRRYYRITAEGARSAKTVFQEIQPVQGSFAWA